MGQTLLFTTTAVAFAFVWIPRIWFFVRWRYSARSAVMYRLVPTGQRPVDLDAVAKEVSGQLAAVDTHQLWQLHRGGIVIHRFRDDEAIVTALTVYGYDDPDRIADGIASAAGSTAHRDEDLALPITGTVWATHRRTYVGRNNSNQAGLPPVESAADEIVRTMATHPNANVCLSVACEPTRGWEDERLRDWYQSRSGIWDDTESVGSGQASRVIIAAASDDPTLAKTLASSVPDQLHRWPFQDRGIQVNSARGWAATALALAIPPLVVVIVQMARWGAAGIGFVNDVALKEMGWADALKEAFAAGPATVMLAGAAGLGLAAAIAWQTGSGFNTAQREWKGLLDRGLLPVERSWRYSPMRWYRYRRHLQERIRSRHDDNASRPGIQIAGPYPYRANTLLLSSHQVGQLLAFPSVSDTSAQQTSAVEIGAPPEVVEAAKSVGREEGSLLGHDMRERPVVILDGDRKHGVFIVGDPGTGKSNALTQLFAEDAQARKGGVRRHGRMAMLWVETKGGGADDAERVLRHGGYRPNGHPDGYVRIDAASPSGPRLELLDPRDPDGSAARLVAAMRYSFDEGSIGSRSEAALYAAFRLVLRLTGDDAYALGLTTDKALAPNPIAMATILMEQKRANRLKVKLLEVLTHKAVEDRKRTGWTPPPDVLGAQASAYDTIFNQVEDEQGAARKTGSAVFDALSEWNYYEASITSREWASIFEAPRNKLVALSRFSGVWTPDPKRVPVTVGDLLNHHAVAILNFGSAPDGEAVDDDTAARMGAIFTHLLWQTIRKECVGWLDRGRSIGVYADELSHLSGTGSGDDVIAEMHDKGRSFGMQLNFATQRYAQLPRGTAEAAGGFGTRVYFALEQAQLNTAAALDLCGGTEGAITARDIRQLPRGRAAIRLRLRGSGTAPFTVDFPHALAGVPHIHDFPRELTASTGTS